MRFLEGTWINTDVTIRPGHPPELRTHYERMSVQDDSTLVITAFGLGDDGRDITRPITFVERGDTIIMAQRDFEARGTRRANRFSLTGDAEGFSYEFRLYMLQDHYVYQMDVWSDGQLVHSQMSYLYRAPEAR